MQEKELRKMTRSELIEIIYALQQNEKRLIAEKEELQAKLDDRVIRINNAGSLAEASLAVNQIFEACQMAANDYLRSIAYMHEETERRAKHIMAQTKKRSDQILKEAHERAAEMQAEAEANEDEHE